MELDTTGLELDEGPLPGLEETEESPEDGMEDGLAPETEDELAELEVKGALATGEEDVFEPGVDEGLAPGVEDGVGIPTGLELSDWLGEMNVPELKALDGLGVKVGVSVLDGRGTGVGVGNRGVAQSFRILFMLSA